MTFENKNSEDSRGPEKKVDGFLQLQKILSQSYTLSRMTCQLCMKLRI